ncbi:hypothetical protein J6590_041393 [Homalodisca vitripennis]|nr:hypothetical protein J6590_041393 [Homalodisca vitripennis]
MISCAEPEGYNWNTVRLQLDQQMPGIPCYISIIQSRLTSGPGITAPSGHSVGTATLLHLHSLLQPRLQFIHRG